MEEPSEYIPIHEVLFQRCSFSNRFELNDSRYIITKNGIEKKLVTTDPHEIETSNYKVNYYEEPIDNRFEILDL